MTSSTARSKKYRENNRLRYNAYHRSYRNTPIEQMLLDPNEIWFTKDYRKRKKLKQATPAWANHRAIREIYQQCLHLNQQYPGMGFTVHHIIPISHPKVCGLHVPENLTIVSNSAKQLLGRKFKEP